MWTAAHTKRTTNGQQQTQNEPQMVNVADVFVSISEVIRDKCDTFHAQFPLLVTKHHDVAFALLRARIHKNYLVAVRQQDNHVAMRYWETAKSSCFYVY